MKSNDAFTSTCRHCRFYSPEGRRGGHCNQLNVAVRSGWKACSLATPIFEPEWGFSAIPVWHRESSFALSTHPEGITFTQPVEPMISDAEVKI
jgi:hypothetical protein